MLIKFKSDEIILYEGIVNRRKVLKEEILEKSLSYYLSK